MVKWGMMAAKHSEIVSVWGIVEDCGFVIQTRMVRVMYGHFDELSMVNMQAFLKNTRKMQFFAHFRIYGVYRLKTSA